jgi:hypothetical protein
MSNDDADLDIMSYLWGAVDMYETDLSTFYEPAANDEDRETERRIDQFAGNVLQALYDPKTLRTLLTEIQESQPWNHRTDHLLELLRYEHVHRQAASAVARDVLSRFHGVQGRITHALYALVMLHQTDPSETALKYVKQVLVLYLAGFSAEVYVMCGAVLESALRVRIPDKHLRERGVRPALKRRMIIP